MIEIVERTSADARPDFKLSLPFEDRQRSRLRVRLESGEIAALSLDRGSVLRGGDRLRTACGRVVEVLSAVERVSLAETTDPLLLTRAAYHLGNRHVPVEVRAGALLYLHDHVLDDMMRGLGLAMRIALESFEPEGGAYGGKGGHGHHHGHEGRHGHSEGHVAVRVESVGHGHD